MSIKLLVTAPAPEDAETLRATGVEILAEYPDGVLVRATDDQASASRLTTRQLEVTLLLRDGLRQTEIAACLGISVRQVERLLASARERVDAATTTQLVAMLATGALGPRRPE
jgi:DNA-binding CsgD family transcriptional regulator